MHFIWVVGFIWSISYVSLYIGLKTFPQNIWLIPKDIMSWTYTLNHGGETFGLNMMYFAWGYIITVSFLNYSNYIPLDFFTSIEKKVEAKEQNTRLKTFVGEISENAGVDIVNVVHSDLTESKYFIK
jgi:hypothetical protein